MKNDRRISSSFPDKVSKIRASLILLVGGSPYGWTVPYGRSPMGGPLWAVPYGLSIYRLSPMGCPLLAAPITNIV